MDRAFTTYRMRGGDEDLLALLNACRPRAFGLCFRILRNREDAEDACQRVLLEVARHAGGLTDAAAFRSWFFRVCRARCADLQRRRARRENHEAKVARPEDSNGGPAFGSDEEARRLLFAALAELSEEDRTLVVEHYFQKVPLKVLAERRSRSRVSIWKRLRRIRTALLRRMSGTGFAVFLPVWKDQLRGEPPPPGVYPSESGPASSRAGIHPAFRPSLWVAGVAAGLVLFCAGLTIGRRDAHSRVAPASPLSATPRSFMASWTAAAPLPSEGFEASPPESAAVASAAAPDPAPAESLREMIRRLFKEIQAQRKTGRWMPVEVSKGLAPLTEHLREARREPSKNSEHYAEIVGLLYEVAGEECGVRLSAGDLELMRRLKTDLVEALRRVPTDAPAPERLLAAVEADLAFVRGMAELLPGDEAPRMMASDIDFILKRGKRKSVPEDRLKKEVVADWTSAIGAERNLDSILDVAAGRFTAALKRITEEFRSAGASYDGDEYSKSLCARGLVLPYDPVRRIEYQVEALKAQIDALRLLRTGLDPAEADRLAASETWNYAISRRGMLIEMRDD
jgi:RNA polymerase sigma-70 factor (ECF subfamily)